MKTLFNHSPFVTGVWVPFNGQRFKDPYMIRLHTGEAFNAFPNGGAWTDKGSTWYEDSSVKEVVLMPDGMGQRRGFTGEARILRNIEYFGKRYPVYIVNSAMGRTFMSLEDIEKTGLRLIPHIVYGVRPLKNNPENKATFFIAAGELAPHDDPRPDASGLQAFTDNMEVFWPDQEQQVMANNDVIVAITNFIKYHDVHEADREVIHKLGDRFNSKPQHIVQSMPILASLLNDKGMEELVNFMDQAMQAERNLDKRGSYYAKTEQEKRDKRKAISAGESYFPIWKVLQNLSTEGLSSEVLY